MSASVSVRLKTFTKSVDRSESVDDWDIRRNKDICYLLADTLIATIRRASFIRAVLLLILLR